MTKGLLLTFLSICSVSCIPLFGIESPDVVTPVHLSESIKNHVDGCVTLTPITPGNKQPLSAACHDLFEKDVPSMKSKIFNNEDFTSCVRGNIQVCRSWLQGLTPLESAVFHRAYDFVVNTDYPRLDIQKKEVILKQLEDSPYTTTEMSLGRYFERKLHALRDKILQTKVTLPNLLTEGL